MRGGARREVSLVLGALALAGCAGARVDLAVGTLPPLARVEAPLPARLVVLPVEDGREPQDREGHTGLFLQGVGDAGFTEDVPGAVTALLLRRLGGAGLFAELRGASPGESSAPGGPPPAGGSSLVLRGRLATLSGERDTQLTPIISFVTLPLFIPVAIAGAVRAVPTPLGALVPVTYVGKAVLEVELVDAETEAVLWRREVEGIARREVEGWNDLFASHRRRMAEAAREALDKAVTNAVGALAFDVARPPTEPGAPSRAGALGR